MTEKKSEGQFRKKSLFNNHQILGYTNANSFCKAYKRYFDKAPTSTNQSIEGAVK